MSLSALSIRRPVFAWMLMAALMIFGALCFQRLGVSRLPDVDFPIVSVSVSLRGAAPAVMESSVIEPLEGVLMQIPGIRNLSSSSQQSSGSISIEFEVDKKIDDAVQEVEDRIHQLRDVLPKDLDPPSVKKSNPEDMPILWVAVTHDEATSDVDAMLYVRNVLSQHFTTLSGVGDVVLAGYVEPAIRVHLNPLRMTELQLAAEDVIQAISTEQVSVPLGRLESPAKEVSLRFLGEATSAQQLGQIRLMQRGAEGANFRPILLQDVARIEEGTLDVRRKCRYRGMPALGLGILKQHGSNAVEVARLIRERVKEIEPHLPRGYQLKIRSDSTRFIQQSIAELNRMLFFSAMLTSVVCYLFLGSLASTLNVLLAIPTSILGSFIGLYFLGFTLNTFTLLGLTLSIGVVVDDAIMMLENIVRHREMGRGRKEAALMGSQEITFAAVASTLAVGAIFLPVAWMRSGVGQFLYQYGVSVSLAVGLSLLEALTLTPMRCSRFLEVNHAHSKLSHFMDQAFRGLTLRYQKTLAFFLQHRVKTLILSTLFFALTLLLARRLPSELLPSQDQSQLMIRVKGKVGSSLAATDEVFRNVESYLSAQPSVEGYFSLIGGFGGDAVHQGFLFVTLVDKDQRPFSQSEIMGRMRKDLKAKVQGAEIVVQDLSLRGFGTSRGFPIELSLEGPDWEKLVELSETYGEELKKSGRLTDVHTDIQKGMPEVDLVTDSKKLALHGVTVAAVNSAVSTLFGGRVLSGRAQVQKQGHRLPIEVRLPWDERNQVQQLKQIWVRNNRGQLVSLSELVHLQSKPSLTLITRQNRVRSISIYANPQAHESHQRVMEEIQEMGKRLLPPGYYVKTTGSSQNFKESLQGLGFALGLGIVVSYLVLASQFNSFLLPWIVLLALPFSLSGGILGLFLFHQSINLYSLIGLILLMGIAKKNSILLVDFTNQCVSEGRGVHQALLEACPIRLRPILMTSLATVVGALPEALSIGPGAESTVPMAVVLIGGICVSTLLTLFVVPCAYDLLMSRRRSTPA
ncbi:MAG: efflux RND transporter permease subunit [Bdellovibrionia bacterium]